MKITMTLPDRLGQAVAKKAGEYDMEVSEFLKHVIFAAAGPQGYLLKIDLPPLERSGEPELPLFGAPETEVGF